MRSRPIPLADLVACAAAGKSDFFRAHFARKVVVLGVVLDVEDRKLTSLRLATRPERGANGARCLLPPQPGLFRDDARRDTIPGVYVMATAVNNLIDGDRLRPLPRAGTVAIVLAAALAAALFGLILRPVMAAAAAFGAALIWAAVVTLAFRHQLVLPLLAPPIAAGFSLALLTGYRFGVADRDKRLLRRSFAFYLAPTLIDRMLAAEKLPELGGESRVVTILFADLAGFTVLSEPLEPPTLVAIINAYFTAMSEIIEAEGGFIQDYAGDALLAIFGAPIEDSAHAGHAVMAALRCRDRLATLAEENDLLRGHTLSMRIGLNSGQVLVGNIGSTQRLKYTAMGDAVNLAARLETANKPFGTTIFCFGHDTSGGWRRICLAGGRPCTRRRPRRAGRVMGTARTGKPNRAGDLDADNSLRRGAECISGRRFRQGPTAFHGPRRERSAGAVSDAMPRGYAPTTAGLGWSYAPNDEIGVTWSCGNDT